jgi:RDD family
MSNVAIPSNSPAAARPCPSCGRQWGGGISCQFCDQVEGLPSGVHLSSPARRFGGYVLEAVLSTVTLGIGWLIWAFVVFGRGQTPAKQMLGMRVVTLRTGEKATWGRMFVRELIAKPLVAMLSLVTLGIANFWLVWDGRNQELWDKVVATIVVNDRDKQLVAGGQTAAPALEAPVRSEHDSLPFPTRTPEPAAGNEPEQ